ncbi:hypothetical protein D9M71_298290 [compost metagenome]
MHRSIDDQRILAGYRCRFDLMVDDHDVANRQIAARMVNTDLLRQLLVAERFGVVYPIEPELPRCVVVALGCIEEHRAIAAHEWTCGAAQPVWKVFDKLLAQTLLRGTAQGDHGCQAVHFEAHQRGAVFGLILLRQCGNSPQLLMEYPLGLRLEIVGCCSRQLQFRARGGQVRPESTKPVEQCLA